MRLFLLVVVIFAAAGVAAIAGYSAFAGGLATMGTYLLAGLSLIVVIGLAAMKLSDCRFSTCTPEERKRWEQAQRPRP